MTDKKPPFNPAEALKRAKLDPLKEVQKPPTVIKIKGIHVLNSGSISVVTGKAKARKGFLMGLIAAAAAIGKCSIDTITGSFANGKNQILYFDTEQGEYWGQVALNRICKNIGIADPVNLHYFDLQSYSPEERISMINHEILTRENILLVIIDGVRDLITSINEEGDATMITTHILKWCASRQIHILTALHMNKADSNVRGHIGSELVNKSEIVISVTKEKDETITTVKAEYSRGEPFTSFSFLIDEEGLPRLTEADKPVVTKKEDKKKECFDFIFRDKHKVAYSYLVEKYIIAHGGVKERAAKLHIAEALRSGMLKQDEQGNYLFPRDYESSTGDNTIPF